MRKHPSESETTIGRPALRFHGGKFKMRRFIASNMPPHRSYVEPFMGAASVFFAKPRCYAEVLNDLDDEIVGFFRVLRDPLLSDRLRRQLELTPFARTEFVAAHAGSDDPVERARRMLVRSYMGFGSDGIFRQEPHGMRTKRSTWGPAVGNTGFRPDSKKAGTTPAHDWESYPCYIEQFCLRLRGVVLENRPALEVIAQHDDPDCLIYCDPPYVHSTRCMGSKRTRGLPANQYRHEMTDGDHRDLAHALQGAKGMAMLSGYDCDLYRDLYAHWTVIRKDSRADGGAARQECLWLSPRTVEANKRNNQLWQPK